MHKPGVGRGEMGRQGLAFPQRGRVQLSLVRCKLSRAAPRLNPAHPGNPTACTVCDQTRVLQGPHNPGILVKCRTCPKDPGAVRGITAQQKHLPTLLLPPWSARQTHSSAGEEKMAQAYARGTLWAAQSPLPKIAAFSSTAEVGDSPARAKPSEM